jgi:hypothetical protein
MFDVARVRVCTTSAPVVAAVLGKVTETPEGAGAAKVKEKVKVQESLFPPTVTVTG